MNIYKLNKIAVFNSYSLSLQSDIIVTVSKYSYIFTVNTVD